MPASPILTTLGRERSEWLASPGRVSREIVVTHRAARGNHVVTTPYNMSQRVQGIRYYISTTKVAEIVLLIAQGGEAYNNKSTT